MKKIAKLILFSLLVCLILSGCCLSHEWTEASCEAPKTCTKCDKTEGEALGHESGNWVNAYNIMDCTLTKEERCHRCGLVLNSESGELTSFIADGSFVFTPEQFVEKVVNTPVGWAAYPNAPLSCEWRNENGILEALISYEEEQMLLQFCKADGTLMTAEEAQSTGIHTIRCYDLSQTITHVSIALQCCDPMAENGVQIGMSILYANISGMESFEYNGIAYSESPVSGQEIGFPELEDVRCYYISVM